MSASSRGEENSPSLPEKYRTIRSGWHKRGVVHVAYPRMRNAPQQQRPRLQPGAAGVNEPWKTNDTAPAFVSTPTAVSRDFTEAFLHVRFSTPTAGSRPPLLSPHVTSVPGRQRCRCCKCVSPTARRADARRSCGCAFVHRKNGFFAGKRSLCNKSGGASAPRGFAAATAPAIGARTVGGLP